MKPGDIVIEEKSMCEKGITKETFGVVRCGKCRKESLAIIPTLKEENCFSIDRQKEEKVRESQFIIPYYCPLCGYKYPDKIEDTR